MIRTRMEWKGGKFRLVHMGRMVCVEYRDGWATLEPSKQALPCPYKRPSSTAPYGPYGAQKG